MFWASAFSTAPEASRPAMPLGSAGELGRSPSHPAGSGDEWDRLAAIDPHPVSYALSCPWCAAPYLALPIVAGAVLRRRGFKRDFFCRASSARFVVP